MGALQHSNVARTFMGLDLDDPAKQIGGYLRGVGTVLHPDVRRAVSRTEPGVIQLETPGADGNGFRRLEVVGGLAFGYGVTRNVLRMYEVLSDHYNPGDRIFLFGFSRGAFTVRVLGGLLHRCGILRPEWKWRAEEAFSWYKPHYESFKPSEQESYKAKVQEFRNKYAHPGKVEIHFLGIWDTVKSVGFVWQISLPHTRHNPDVATVRHALALDERRSFYIPTSWGGIDTDGERPIKDQDVQEVWFAGVHSDVGGGYDEAENGLAQFSFEWIVSEAMKSSADGKRIGLLVEEKKRREMFSGGQGSTAWLNQHDELAKRGWRALEWMPRLELENEPPPPKRLRRWGPAGERQINKFQRSGKVLIHPSVKQFRAEDEPPLSRIENKEFL